MVSIGDNKRLDKKHIKLLSKVGLTLSSEDVNKYVNSKQSVIVLGDKNKVLGYIMCVVENGTLKIDRYGCSNYVDTELVLTSALNYLINDIDTEVKTSWQKLTSKDKYNNKINKSSIAVKDKDKTISGLLTLQFEYKFSYNIDDTYTLYTKEKE